MRTRSTDAEAEHRAVQGLQTQLTRRAQECRDERSMALQLGAQHSEVEAFARTLAAESRQHEFARAELRTSFDENRAQMIHYLGEEFEQKLQWEENEHHYHLTSEEQQLDNLVADLEDRNGELIAEVNSLRSFLTTEQNSPPQGGALPVNVVGLSERALLRNQAHGKVVPQRRAFRVRVMHGFPLCPIRGRFQSSFRAFWEGLRSSTLVTQLRPGLPGLRGQPLNRVRQPSQRSLRKLPSF